MKYKVRRKKVFKTWYIFAILIVILVVISTSYALWSTTLYINGTVTGTNKQTEIPVTLIPKSGTDQYVVTDFAQNVAIIESQYIEKNVLIVNYLAKDTKGTPRNTTIDLNFQNDHSETLQNGTVTYEITGDSAFFSSQPTITTTSSVNSGGNGTVSIKMTRLRFNSLLTSATCKIKVTYQLGGQNIEFYIQLNFTR